jgi:hypothetical protein
LLSRTDTLIATPLRLDHHAGAEAGAAGKGSDFGTGQGTFLADILRAMRQRGEARAATPQLVIELFDGAGDRSGF